MTTEMTTEMTTQVQEKTRFSELDFVRAIAIIAVIVIHVTSITLTKIPTDDITALLSLVLNQLSRFCVPAFLFVSGILAFHSFKKHTYVQVLKGKTNSLLIPYVIWTILGLLFFQMYSTNYKGIIMIFMTGNGPFYQLYYIPLLFQLFVVLPLMMKFISSKKFVVILSILTMLLFIVYEVIILKAVLSEDFIGSTSALLQSTFVYWLIYFYLGIFAAQHYVKLLDFIKSKSTSMFVVVYLVSAVALVVDAYIGFITYKHVELMNYFRVTVFIYSIASIALLIRLGMIYHWKMITHLYRNSFGIYLIHVVFIKILFLISSLFFSNVLYIVLSIVLTTLISYWLIEMIKWTPLSFLLIGKNNYYYIKKKNSNQYTIK